MLQKNLKWKWIITALLCFLLVNILPSSFIEQHYSKGFFLGIRKFFDHTLGKLPFPSYYLFAALMLFFLINWILHFFTEKPQPFTQRLFRVLSFGGFMTTLFFILWGFNYGRIPIEEKLNLNIQPLTEEQLVKETKSTVAHLLEIRGKINRDTNSMPEIVFINNIEENSKRALNNCLKSFSYDTSNVRGRFLFEDAFLAFNIGGQYLPFVGEGNVDDAVFYSKKPFYLIHEMSHGNGFTEEADCNFLAYAACEGSGNLSLQYSGELNYLLYLLPEISIRDKDLYISVWSEIPRVIQKDLMELKKYYEKHTFKTGFLGEAINNYYLKLMGVQGGTKNYDKMILLIYAWKNK